MQRYLNDEEMQIEIVSLVEKNDPSFFIFRDFSLVENQKYVTYLVAMHNIHWTFFHHYS